MIVGGVDTSFSDTVPQISIAFLVCFKYPDITTPIYSNHTSYETTLQYTPGQLGQKECPAYLELIKKCPPEFLPQLIFVDGFGILHPERYGSATRLGTMTQIPTIGVSKKLYIGTPTAPTVTANKASISEASQNGEDQVFLYSKEEEVLGVAWRNTGLFKRFIYISVGWGIGLEDAIDWTRKCCLFRVPEPIRQADLLSRKISRKLKNLNNILLVCTLDGNILGIEKTTGRVLWSVSDDWGSAVKVENRASVGIDSEGGIGNSESLQGLLKHGLLLPEPLGQGDLYFFAQGQIRKLPLSIKQIKPFVTTGNVGYLSSTSSKIIAIDPISGKTVPDSTSNSDPISKEPISKPILLTRTDHVLTIMDLYSGLVISNISYAEYSHAYFNPTFQVNNNFKITSNLNGKLIIQSSTGLSLLTLDFIHLHLSSPAISVFDTHSTISSYHVQKLFPSDQSSKSHSDSVYIGSVHDNLFVLSADSQIKGIENNFISDNSQVSVIRNSPVGLYKIEHVIGMDSPIITTDSEHNYTIPILMLTVFLAIAVISWYFVLFKKVLNLFGFGIAVNKALYDNSIREETVSDTISQKTFILENTLNQGRESAETGILRKRKKKKQGSAPISEAVLPKENSIPIQLMSQEIPSQVRLPDRETIEPVNNAVDSDTKMFPSSFEKSQELKAITISNEVLGRGSHGTIVFKGTFESRPVAIKRLLLDFYDIAFHEVKILRESDTHPNVIRYFFQEKSNGFMYIALELCPASLHDVVEGKQFRKLRLSMTPNDTFSQIISGLEHIHSLKLVHRDIKPANILISPNTNPRVKAHARILISDFGLCKKLDDGQSSFHNTISSGTIGWRAPECMQNTNTITKSIDIFATGLVFYYFLTGNHPFGDKYQRELNIQNGKSDTSELKAHQHPSEITDLITRMIAFKQSRIETALILKHPYFWTCEKKIKFFADASDRFEPECRDPISPLLQTLEQNAATILGVEWYKKLDKRIMENLTRWRWYNAKLVVDLLRVIRNLKHHYQNLSDDVKVLFRNDVMFVQYFEKRFPQLLMYTYTVIKDSKLLQDEGLFDAYYC